MKRILIIVLLGYSFSLIAQQADTTSSQINYYKLGVIGGVTTGGFVYSWVLQRNLWWKGEKSKFHSEWKNDWKYALGSDKFGHFYFPYIVSNVYADAFQWAGIDKNESYIYSASLALLHQTFTEIRDGFSKEWGFSWGDFSANTLGAVYPLLQNKYTILKNFNFKISYYPSARFKNNAYSSIIDDYESTYDWLSINVYNILPEDYKKYYPSFINIAIGHSVRNLDYPDKSYHEIYIGLDWNIEALPGESDLLKKIKKYLNFYHFPAPAVRITPNVAWFGLKF